MNYGSDRERTRPQDLKLENINYDSTLEMPSPPISPLKESFYKILPNGSFFIVLEKN